jgi:hypothetical protein
MKEGNNIILYQDDNEITRVSVRFAAEEQVGYDTK